MIREDDWSVPISALQHYLYCPRQCALIQLEQIWTENTLTAQGRLMHQRADEPRSGGRRGTRTVTAMPLSQPALGIHGIADVVEFTGHGEDSVVMPVEYKRGRPKQHRADEVQLCAQALCLEHMLGRRIDRGALFYGQPRRRHEVALDDELRTLTLRVIADVRAMFSAGMTPTATYDAARCDRCSLLADCRPRLLSSGRSVRQWLERRLKD
jgi:CRISPR-associated exonuclease Cas4